MPELNVATVEELEQDIIRNTPEERISELVSKNAILTIANMRLYQKAKNRRREVRNLNAANINKIHLMRILQDKLDDSKLLVKTLQDKLDSKDK